MTRSRPGGTARPGHSQQEAARTPATNLGCHARVGPSQARPHWQRVHVRVSRVCVCVCTPAHVPGGCACPGGVRTHRGLALNPPIPQE